MWYLGEGSNQYNRIQQSALLQPQIEKLKTQYGNRKGNIILYIYIFTYSMFIRYKWIYEVTLIFSHPQTWPGHISRLQLVQPDAANGNRLYGASGRPEAPWVGIGLVFVFNWKTWGGNIKPKNKLKTLQKMEHNGNFRENHPNFCVFLCQLWGYRMILVVAEASTKSWGFARYTGDICLSTP